MVDPAYRVEQVFIILVTSTLFILHVAVIISTYYDIHRALFYRHYMQRVGCIASFLLVLLSIDPYGINGIYPPSFAWFLANLATTLVFSSAAGYFYLLCDTHYRNLQHPSPPLRIFKRFLYCLMCGMLIMSIIPMIINLITQSEVAQALFLLYTTMVSFADFVILNIQSNRLVYALDCYLESILPTINIPLQVSNPVPGPRPSYLHRSGIQHATNMSHMVRHVSFANHSSYDIARKSTYLPQQSSSSTYSSAQPSSSQQTTPRNGVDHDLMEHSMELTTIITKLRIFQVLGSIILLSTAMINAVVSMENIVNGRSFQSDPNNFNGLRNWYVWELCAALTVGLYVAWVPLRCKPLPESSLYGRNRTNTHRPYNEHIDGKKQHIKLNLNHSSSNHENDSIGIPLPTITQDYSSMNKDERKTTLSLTVNPVYEERPSIYTAIHTATSTNMHHPHDPTQTPSQTTTYTPSQITTLPPRPSPLQLTSTLPSRPSSPSVHVRPSIRLSSPRLPPLHMSPIPLPHALPSQSQDGDIPAPA